MAKYDIDLQGKIKQYGKELTNGGNIPEPPADSKHYSLIKNIGETETELTEAQSFANPDTIEQFSETTPTDPDNSILKWRGKSFSGDMQKAEFAKNSVSGVIDYALEIAQETVDRIIYVDCNNGVDDLSTNDGTSWATAFRTIPFAIKTVKRNCPVGISILLSTGVHDCSGLIEPIQFNFGTTGFIGIFGSAQKIISSSSASALVYTDGNEGFYFNVSEGGTLVNLPLNSLKGNCLFTANAASGELYNPRINGVPPGSMIRYNEGAKITPCNNATVICKDVWELQSTVINFNAKLISQNDIIFSPATIINLPIFGFFYINIKFEIYGSNYQFSPTTLPYSFGQVGIYESKVYIKEELNIDELPIALENAGFERNFVDNKTFLTTPWALGGKAAVYILHNGMSYRYSNSYFETNAGTLAYGNYNDLVFDGICATLLTPKVNSSLFQVFRNINITSMAVIVNYENILTQQRISPRNDELYFLYLMPRALKYIVRYASTEAFGKINISRIYGDIEGAFTASGNAAIDDAFSKFSLVDGVTRTGAGVLTAKQISSIFLCAVKQTVTANSLFARDVINPRFHKEAHISYTVTRGTLVQSGTIKLRINWVSTTSHQSAFTVTDVWGNDVGVTFDFTPPVDGTTMVENQFYPVNINVDDSSATAAIVQFKIDFISRF